RPRDPIKPVVQVGAQDAQCHVRVECGEDLALLPFFEPIAAPPGAEDGIALEHLLQSSYEHGIIFQATGQTRGDRGADLVPRTGAGRTGPPTPRAPTRACRKTPAGNNPTGKPWLG